MSKNDCKNSAANLPDQTRPNEVFGYHRLQRYHIALWPDILVILHEITL